MHSTTFPPVDSLNISPPTDFVVYHLCLLSKNLNSVWAGSTPLWKHVIPSDLGCLDVSWAWLVLGGEVVFGLLLVLLISTISFVFFAFMIRRLISEPLIKVLCHISVLSVLPITEKSNKCRIICIFWIKCIKQRETVIVESFDAPVLVITHSDTQSFSLQSNFVQIRHFFFIISSILVF